MVQVNSKNELNLMLEPSLVKIQHEEDATKAKYKKDMVRAKRIIVKSIKDHLIPQVSSKNNPK
jgi:hypothetical protein